MIAFLDRAALWLAAACLSFGMLIGIVAGVAALIRDLMRGAFVVRRR